MSDDGADYYSAGDDEEYAYEDDDDAEYEYAEEMVRTPSDGFGTREQGLGVESDEKTLRIAPEDGYVVKSCMEVVPLMNCLVKEVSSVLDVPFDTALILIQHYKWDKERLLNAFFSDPEQVQREAGIDLLGPSTELRIPASGVFSCGICCDDDVSPAEGVAMGCQHVFCKDCFTQYLKIQVDDGISCLVAHCPEPDCKQKITKTIYHRLLAHSHPKQLERYDLYFVRNFIEMSKQMRYCPAPGCDKVVVGTGVTTVRCSCSYPFCFRCGEEAHDPCSCAQLMQWVEKCSNESETANWILVNTRRCPGCNSRIEKNQGCNHMTCRECKHDFCWICMGPWSEHGQNSGGYYKCNKFTASEQGKNQGDAAKAQRQLERYLHYYQRYHAHDEGIKYAAKQHKVVERRMQEEHEAHQSSWIDVQFLKQAAELVMDARRVLKFTYTMGYFLPDDTAEKKLFEHHQEMLEKHVENLQEFSEKAIDLIDRMQVVNLTRVTDRFMQSLLSIMAGGVIMMDDSLLNTSGGTSAPSSAPSSAKKASSMGVKSPETNAAAKAEVDEAQKADSKQRRKSPRTRK